MDDSAVAGDCQDLARQLSGWILVFWQSTLRESVDDHRARLIDGRTLKAMRLMQTLPRDKAISRNPSRNDGSIDADTSMAHVRVNMGWLARAEKGTLLRLAARTPDWVTPDQLTFLGVSGAFLTMVALAFCQVSNAFVLPAILGLFLHWLGDSLDGTLARHRQIERPRIGYFIDHSCDLISQVMIFIGLGLSPYFTIISALLALSMYFLISSYTYLKVMIFKSHQLAYGGVGATELRLVIACWCALGVLIGPALSETEYMGFRVIDGVIGSAWALIFVGFIGMVWKDLAKVRDHFPEENASMQQPSWSSSYTPPPAEGFPVDA